MGTAHSYCGHDDTAGGEVPGRTLRGPSRQEVGWERLRHQMTSRHLFLSLSEVPQGTHQVLLSSWGVLMLPGCWVFLGCGPFPRRWHIPRILICCARCCHFPGMLICSPVASMFPGCSRVPQMLECSWGINTSPKLISGKSCCYLLSHCKASTGT